MTEKLKFHRKGLSKLHKEQFFLSNLELKNIDFLPEQVKLGIISTF